MRDDKWLFQQLDEVWDTFFPDVPQDNDVQIVWGRKARQRLGSIKQAPSKITNYKLQITNKDQNSKLENSKLSRSSELGTRNSSHPATIITINSLFKNPEIPDFVVTATIAHEMAHYAHGFHSPIQRKFAKPHEGGVVHKELANRGVEKLEKMQKTWLKENWKEYLEKHFPAKARKLKRRTIIRFFG